MDFKAFSVTGLMPNMELDIVVIIFYKVYSIKWLKNNETPYFKKTSKTIF